MKKVLSIVLSLMFLLTIVPVGTIGAEAVEDDVIEIRTIADLYNINNNMSGNYKLMNDIDMTDDVAVGGDWDFMGNGWEPIGSNGIYTNTAFTGTFDGNGHKIIGMRIEVNTKPSGTGTIYLGLFASNAGTIKNLGIDKTSTVSKGYYSGSICSYNTGTISNCYNEANVSSNTCSGGICSYSTQGDFVNCYNTGDITTITSSSEKFPYVYTGGICGKNFSVIKNCYNKGKIVSESSESNDSSIVCSGGICGFSANSINNCYNLGSISVSSFASNNYCYSGGICGHISSSMRIAKLDAKDYTTGDEDWYAYTWGAGSGKWIKLVDNLAIGLDNNLLFARLPKGQTPTYNWGNIWNLSEDQNNVYGGTFTITSWSDGKDGRMTGKWSNTSTKPQSQTEPHTQTEATVNKDIINCYNTSDISVTIQSSANDSDSINCNGGIVGISDSSIIDSYNIGTADYGICGAVSGNITNCYYLGTAGGSNAGAKALTKAQLQLELCYVGFDFEDTWGIFQQTEYKYPQLRNNLQIQPPTYESTAEQPTTESITEPPTYESTEEQPTIEPTTEPPTYTEPTETQSTTEPITEPPTYEPTESQTTVEPTTEPPTYKSTEAQSTTELTTDSSTYEPTERQTTVEPTTVPPTSEPTEAQVTSEPTTEPPTYEPTEAQATSEPTTEPPTTESAEVQSTAEPTTEPPTTESAEVQPTAEPTTETPTKAQPATDTAKIPDTTATQAVTQSTTASANKPTVKPASKPKSNTLKVSVKKKTVKAKKLKKKAQKIKPLTVKNAVGKVSFKIKKAPKKLKKLVKISKKGIITIKKWKKAKKGNYKIKVTITAAGNKAYLPLTLTKTVKVRIK